MSVSQENKELAAEISSPMTTCLVVTLCMVLGASAPMFARATGDAFQSAIAKIPFVETEAERRQASRQAERAIASGSSPEPAPGTPAPAEAPVAVNSEEPRANKITGGVIIAPPNAADNLGPKFDVNWASQSRRDVARRMAQKCLKELDQAQSIERKHGIPALFVLAIFAREASCDFSKNFLNGQPLNQVTTWVPAGYGPFSSWEASVDAAVGRGYFKGADWSKASEWAWRAEKYNGLGYKNRGLVSPYPWAGDVRYDSQGGKFVRDGVFDRSHMDQQLGVIPLVAMMQEILREQ